MQKWLYLAAAIVSEVTGSLALKAAVDAPGFYVLVLAGYTGSFLGLFASLRHGMSLGVGYGIWGATGVALTALMSYVLFDEPITPVMGVGLVLVMVGVLLVELGSQAAQKTRPDAHGTAEAAR
ncbi:DMT family transporter [Kocuria rhizophila]|uniref:DMT family transporter n=1 Tax=Kocuria rhizophila TaxID=72000 RepID=UPI000EAF7422|nr:SMR family transporter [Kocuria rhizophila]